MASDKNKSYSDYNKLISELKKSGPKRLYLLWGEEDYLCELYFEELKKICLGDDGGQFNYRRLNGSPLDLHALSEALESMPFMGEHSFIELRGFEINSYKDEKGDMFCEIISDIPDYATAVFILPTGYAPRKGLKVLKDFNKYGKTIEFTKQPGGLLVNWIIKRFNAYGKKVGRDECERLILLSGDRMTGLIPEIDKIANYSENEIIDMSTIDKIAHHIPEAKVFKMTDAMSAKDFDSAADYLSELLQSGEPPIKTLSIIGMQMRRLYAARLAIDKKLGRGFVAEVCKTNYHSHADNLINQARGFTLSKLKSILGMCAECDYRMKSSPTVKSSTEDDQALLLELFLRIAVGQ